MQWVHHQVEGLCKERRIPPLPALKMVDVAMGGGKEEHIWTKLFTMRERADGSGGMKPLPPLTLPFETRAAKKARRNALLAAKSQLTHRATIDTDREGPRDEDTYDDAAWLRREDGDAELDSRPVEGSVRNEDLKPLSQQQLDSFLQGLKADARRFTGHVVRTWGWDMVRHLERLKRRPSPWHPDSNSELVIVDALEAIRSLLPNAKPLKGFCLAADFLVPIFYPGTEYEHKGLSDARMMGGIVTGFFKAYIRYHELSEKDLDTAAAKFA